MQRAGRRPEDGPNGWDPKSSEGLDEDSLKMWYPYALETIAEFDARIRKGEDGQLEDIHSTGDEPRVCDWKPVDEKNQQNHILFYNVGNIPCQSALLIVDTSLNRPFADYIPFYDKSVKRDVCYHPGAIVRVNLADHTYGFARLVGQRTDTKKWLVSRCRVKAYPI